MNLLPKDRAETLLASLGTKGISERQIARVLCINRKTVTRYKKWGGLHRFHIQRPTRSVRESGRRIELSYPYVVRVTNDAAELLAVNSIIPKVYPEAMRADICQEIMLALLEGRTTINELRQNRQKSAWFLRKFYTDNFEGAGHAVSLTSDDDGRSYDEIASSIAAKEWHREQYAGRCRYADALMSFQPPTQIDDVWRAQIHKHAERLGLSFDEAAELTEAG